MNMTPEQVLGQLPADAGQTVQNTMNYRSMTAMGYIDPQTMMMYNICGLIITILSIVGMWKVFSKAKEAGWKSIIPIYNIYIMLKIINRPWWWLLLLLIPLVNVVVMVMMMNDLSKSFGKGIGTTLGLIFLSPIFLLILGFDKSEYKKIKRD